MGLTEPREVPEDGGACIFRKGSEEVHLCLTPVELIALPDTTSGGIARLSMGIPEEAVWIAYAFPARLGNPLFQDGSFIYFDAKRQFHSVFRIADQAVGVTPHMFEFSGVVNPKASDIPSPLLEPRRWSPVTLQPLIIGGAHKYAWVCPGEMSEGRSLGGFLYTLQGNVVSTDASSPNYVFFPLRVPSL